MNARFERYLDNLTPTKKMIAREAVAEYLTGESEKVERIDCALRVYKKMRHLSLEDEEHAYVILANSNFRFIKSVEVGTGSQTETNVDVRAVIRNVLLNKATAFYLVHNHPSGRLVPSKSDDELTLNLKKAGEIMKLRFVDHVIIGDGDYYSYAESGKL